MNDVNPDYVVVGEGKAYSLDSLTKATNLVLSGVTSREELKSYAYRPTVVLDGVGDIVKMAHSSRKSK